MKGLNVCGMSRAVLVGVVVAAAVIGGGQVQGKTVYVSTAGNNADNGLSWAKARKTVLGGINAAASGDQVWVAAGTYVERVTLKEGVALYGGFAGGETDLSQRNWTANVTVLDGNKKGSVVTAPSGATAATRIDGFTITNGSASYGGGVCVSFASPTIANNTITGNDASSSAYGGGGVYVGYSSSMIANNTIVGNTGTGGGGVYLYYSSATIVGNTITGNRASEGGGGLTVLNSAVTITNNVIAGNSCAAFPSSSYCSGGGLYVSGSSPQISNNTIIGNRAISDDL